MSLVGKQRGDTRRSWSRTAAALVAGLALAAPAPVGTAAASVDRASPASATTRQAVVPEAARAATVRRREPRTPGGRPRGGRRINAKRVRRRILVALFGIPDTGRQWVRLRRALRHLAPALLTAPLERLVRLPALRLVRRPSVQTSTPRGRA